MLKITILNNKGKIFKNHNCPQYNTNQKELMAIQKEAAATAAF